MWINCNCTGDMLRVWMAAAKNACMVVDDSGALLAYTVTEGSNHQISGFALT